MRISSANPGWQIERADDGALLVSPTGTPGGAKSGEAFAQLYLFAKRAGGKTYDSNTGFKTPGGRRGLPRRLMGLCGAGGTIPSTSRFLGDDAGRRNRGRKSE